MEVTFEITETSLAGAITRAEVVEHDGKAPANYIRNDQAWDVEVEWYLQGWILNSAFFEFLGEWTVTAYLEIMGPGTEPAFSATVPVSTFTPAPAPPFTPPRRNYKATVQMLAGAVEPGSYKIVAAVNYAGSGTPGPIAGHVATTPDLVQIYPV